MADDPKNLIIPLELTKIIYSKWNADLIILDQPDQIYGKALHGQGQVQFKNGNKYKGGFHNGMLHGQGKFQWVNKVYYQGQFRYNKIQGKGSYYYPDGSQYTGQVFDGYKHGFGVFNSFQNKQVYTGQWKCNQQLQVGLRDGEGRIEFQSGAVYEGSFKEGLKWGKGKISFPSGNYYQGQWVNDKKQGYGQMHWLTSGQKYYGQWSNNMQNNFGTYIWLEPKGQNKFLRNRYQGCWKDGNRHGIGVFYYANGSKYVGEWFQNLKQGNAIFIQENGNITQGIFKADRLVKQKKEINYNNELKINLSQSRQFKHNDNNKRKQDQIIQSKQGKNKKGRREDQKNKKKNYILQTKQKKNQSKKNSKKKKDKKEENLCESLRQSQKLIQKKKQIQSNPYSQMLNIQDLLCNIELKPNSLTNLNFIEYLKLTLLRNNSMLKSWYKLFVNRYEMRSLQQSFSLSLQSFWKILKDLKILGGKTSLASINRIFFQGCKNIYFINSNKQQLQFKIDIFKNFKKLNPKSYNDLTFIGNALKISQYLKHQQMKNQFKLRQYQQTNIHQGSKIILFRQFVQLLVRIAYIKYGSILQLNKSVQKLFSKISPIIQNMMKIYKKQTSQTNEILSSVTSFTVKRQVPIYAKNLNQKLFNIITTNQKSRNGIIDRTVKVKQIFNILEKLNYIMEPHQKILFFNKLQKQMDSQITLKGIQANIVKQNKQKKNKKNVYGFVGNSLQNQKSIRIKNLLEYELIFFQFNQIIFLLITRKVLIFLKVNINTLTR